MDKTLEKDRINEIIETVIKVARGDYSVQLELSDKNDDIDSLAIGFNMMIDDIKEKTEEIQAANQQLRASEQQLKAANQQLRASEQHLVAANQQLTAKEQQLRAANQQLMAKEQGLRASQDALMSKVGDLERANRLMVGRELQMIALKGEVNSLLEKSGQPWKYEAPKKIKGEI
ncbi:MAG: HAMP domain-containing protein [Bacteroidetes bacterium]|nr:HAMP domain-containing protein [Bacteroidota bacterium]